MKKVNNREGEERINNFGSIMILKKYKNSNDVDIYFPQYNWIFYNNKYINFQKGKVKCPYECRFYNHGYIGEGEYDSKNMFYNLWMNMLKRCYSDEFHKERPTYIGCRVCDEWLNFQNFAKWCDEHYYTINQNRMELDKDILYKGNKVYEPTKCIFVPQFINTLFVRGDKIRGKYPIGVSFQKKANKYQVTYKKEHKTIYLGLYSSIDEAFECYKKEKETHIKEVADEYKDYIPLKLYEAMYMYEVEITD